MKTACVVGYGSIGARHARILGELGLRVSVVSRREIGHPLRHAGLEQALEREQPDYLVVANATSEHLVTLEAARQGGFGGVVLVEKPLAGRSPGARVVPAWNVFVAYNMRFHAVMRRLKELLGGERVLSAQVYVGEYLPEWRPGTDYRQSYSASAAHGGGVLRDLSHELDYINWLLGRWVRVAAVGGHMSRLEIDSDDLFVLLLATAQCPAVTLQMNYLDRVGRRSIILNTETRTLEADLIKCVITVDRQAEPFACGRDDSYRAMHQAVLAGDTQLLCTVEEGLETLRLVEAAEQAARTGQWVQR